MPGYGSPVAEVAGFEPTHTGVKVPCLTAWLHPSIWSTSRLDFHVTDCPSYALCFGHHYVAPLAPTVQFSAGIIILREVSR